ncbi:MAG: lysostaphin resistance A-like protein, partial [Culicoidibacterales bacterium]
MMIKNLAAKRHYGLMIWYFLLLFTFVGGVIMNFSRSFIDDSETVADFLLYGILVIPMIILLYRELTPYMKYSWDNKWKFIATVIVSYLVMISLESGSNVILALLNITGPSPNEVGVQELFNTLPAFAFISTAFFAPIAEELVFRYLLIGSLKKYVPIWLCGVISTVAFAAIHVTTGNLLHILPYLAAGAVFTISYLKTKNIMVPIGIHIL